jgi:hypothetical protein
MLHWLNVNPSYSRPRVSDDNAFAESLFRTAKYRPEFPARGFVDLDKARASATHFVRWYNVDHLHSGIRYVSPAQRHAGDDTRSWLLGTTSTHTRASAALRAGRAKPATGHPWVPSRSTLNAMLECP